MAAHRCDPADEHVPLVEAVKCHATLESLILKSHPNGRPCFLFGDGVLLASQDVREGDATGVALMQAVKQIHTLRALSIDGGVLMGDATGLALAEAVKQSSTLHSVSIDGGSLMSDATGRALAEAMKENRTVKHLTIKVDNPLMGDATGEALAEAVEQNRTLRSFTIKVHDKSLMGDATGKALAEAVKQNRTLHSFEISAGGKMGDATGEALAEAVKQNSTLRVLTIATGSRMGDATGEALARHIQQNATLQVLQVMTNVSCMARATQAASMRIVARVLAQSSCLHNMRSALMQIARLSCNTGFRSLKGREFRNRVLEFFIPPQCATHRHLLIPEGRRQGEQADTEAAAKRGSASRRIQRSPPRAVLRACRLTAALESTVDHAESVADHAEAPASASPGEAAVVQAEL